MGVKLAEMEEGCDLVLRIRNQDRHMDLGATLIKQLNADIILIEIDFEGTQRLVFDNVQVDLECPQEDDQPIVWRNVKVVSYKEAYALQVHSDGVRNNRRGAFRVSVAQMGSFRLEGGSSQPIMIKDISLTGFAISDRKKDLKLSPGDQGTISFEDWGYQIRVAGRMVRVEEREDMIVYGFQICSQCNELASYINVRQRRNLKQS